MFTKKVHVGTQSAAVGASRKVYKTVIDWEEVFGTLVAIGIVIFIAAQLS